MRNHHVKLLIAGTLLGVSGISSVSDAAATYSVTLLGHLSGGTTATPQAVNDTGAVTGYAAISGGLTHAFLYTAGTGIVDIGTFAGGTSSYGYGINNAGAVVGGSTTAASTRDAFIYSNGVLTDIGSVNTPSASSTNAYAINGNGEAVGYGTRSPGGSIGFDSNNGAPLTTVGTAAVPGATTPTSTLYAINSAGLATGSSTITTGVVRAVTYDTTTGTFTNIGGPAGTSGATGYGINASGEVVGFSLNTSSFQNIAFAYTPGTGVVTLGDLNGGTGSGAPYAVNDSGLIVGGATAKTATGTATHGFIDTIGGTMTDLNSLIDPNALWTLGTAYGISNTGYIVGVGTFNGVANQAYLLTPVPEPASLAVLSLGGVLLGGRATRRFSAQTRRRVL